MSTTATARIAALRALVAPVLSETGGRGGGGVVATGVAAIDRVLGGGFARGTIHDIAPGTPDAAAGDAPEAAGGERPGHAGHARGPGVPAGARAGPATAAGAVAAATGFALALAARAAGRRGEVLWVVDARAEAEWGEIHAAGLAAFGVDPARFLLARVRRGEEALRIMEEALASPALAVVGEMAADRAATLTATRRLALAARDGGFGLLLRPPGGEPSAAATRWRVAASPGLGGDGLGGLGRPAFTLALERNRTGPCGRWRIGWDSDEHIFFEAASRGVARAPRDRPPRPDVAAAA